MSRIVIIGGMGPQASLEIHRRIIARAAANGAYDNADYPEVLHVSIPVPDFISSGDSVAGLRRIERSLRDLKFRADDKVILACNTAHLLLSKIETICGIKVQSLIAATTESVKRQNLKKVGLLASPTTIDKGLYHNPLKEIGTELLQLSAAEMSRIEGAIRHVIANKQPRDVQPIIGAIADRMKRDGAAAVVLGCTELSLIYGDGSGVIDPIEEVLHGM